MLSLRDGFNWGHCSLDIGKDQHCGREGQRKGARKLSGIVVIQGLDHTEDVALV